MTSDHSVQLTNKIDNVHVNANELSIFHNHTLDHANCDDDNVI